MILCDKDIFLVHISGSVEVAGGSPLCWTDLATRSQQQECAGHKEERRKRERRGGEGSVKRGRGKGRNRGEGRESGGGEEREEEESGD